MKHTCTRHAPGSVRCHRECRCRCDRCVSARHAEQARYRATHREQIREKNRRYRLDHLAQLREREAARSRARYAASHPDSHHAPDLSEIAWLLEMGEAPQIIATRMGSTVSAIARRARRLGHVDTARQFEREVRAERAAA